MTREVSLAYEARLALTRHGVLPAPGAWLQQSAGFVAFCDAFDREAARVRRVETS